MKFSKYLPALLVVTVSAAVVQAGPPRRQRWNRGASPVESAMPQMTSGVPGMNGTVVSADPASSYFVPTVVPTEYATSASPVPVSSAEAVTSGSDALAEVNATRAQRGLRPYLPDPLLNQAAQACASQRASRMIQGHLPESDFSYLPAGAHASSAGCAAWTPDWGWGSCCTYDNYTYAGASWVMGRDGRRYMHLFVR